MVNREEEYARIGRERLIAERETERIMRWRMVRAAVECVAACLIGLVIMGTAFAVNDVELGRILLSAGMIVGYAGMCVALFAAYLRARDSGDI